MRGLGLGALLAAVLLLDGAAGNTYAGGRQLQQLREHRYQEAGEADWTELEGVPQAPLVTARSIELAKRMDDGVPVQALGARPSVIVPRAVAPHRTTVLSAGNKASAFASIPPWVFIITFLGAVGAIVILFHFAERMWAKRQESDS